MASGGRKRAEVYAPEASLRRWFGLQRATLNTRGVRYKLNDEGVAVYAMEEVFGKCGDNIRNHFGKAADADPELDLKAEKTRQEIRKLKIENDMKEGELVRASEVEIAYSNGLRAMSDVLDTIPSQLRMHDPDIPSHLLDLISRMINEGRNRAAQNAIDAAALVADSDSTDDE